MALTPEQLKIAQQRANYNMHGGTVNLDPSMLQQSAAEQVFVDPMQQAIDDGYKPGSGFMYEDKFYASGNPGRRSLDMSPLEMLLQENPAAKEAFKASGNKLVMNSNPNPIRPGEPGSPGHPGTQGGSSIYQGPGSLLPSMNPFDDPNYRPTYSGSMMGGADNPYSSLINDYIQSDYFDSSSFDQGFAVARPAVTINDPLFGQVHGGYNPYNTQGFSDFLENSYGGMQDRMQQRDVKSQEFMDKFDLYGDAYNIRFPGENTGMPEFITGGIAPDGTAQLPGPIMQGPILKGGPKILGPFDPNFVPSSPFDPVTSTGGYETYTGNPMPGFNFEGGPAPQEPGQEPNTTDIFGAGNNPINNPIAPMPSPVTPPPGMSSGHSHDDLLSGIGKLFEQYFPQRGGTSTPSATQPVFDAVGNSAPAQQTSPQVFGNMITPFGRQG